MKANEVVKAIMKDNKVKQETLARTVGLPDARYISARLNYPNLSVTTLCEMLEGMGYELVAQRKTGGQRKEGSYVITGKEGEAK